MRSQPLSRLYNRGADDEPKTENKQCDHEHRGEIPLAKDIVVEGLGPVSCENVSRNGSRAHLNVALYHLPRSVASKIKQNSAMALYMVRFVLFSPGTKLRLVSGSVSIARSDLA